MRQLTHLHVEKSLINQLVTLTLDSMEHSCSLQEAEQLHNYVKRRDCNQTTET